MMEYTQLTQEERDELVAQVIYGREREHFEYSLQIESQEHLLQELPVGPWPEHLVYLQGKGRDEMVMMAKSPEDLELAADYAERDRIELLVAAAKIERTRVTRYHAEALKAIPEERRDAAFDSATTKRTELENTSRQLTGR